MVSLAIALLLFQVADRAQPGLTALDQGRFHDARTLLEIVVKEQTQNGPAWAGLARTYGALGLKVQAVEAAKRAEPLSARSPETQHALALYYAQSGNRSRAAELECLYAASPRADTAAAARAAMLSAEVKRWPQAIEFGRKALERGQRLDLLLPMLVSAYEATGRMDEAMEMRRRYAASAALNEEAQAGYGIALLRAARFREAAEQLERARKTFDKSTQIELALGTAYYAQRRFPEAGERFFRVIELDASIHQPYIFLARMIEQAPERAAKFVALAKAWNESGTRHAFAPYVYAKALAVTGAADDLIRPLIEEAMRRDGAQWEFPFEMGQLLERARDYAGAVSAYEKSIAAAAKRPEPHYRIARMYDRLGRTADAQRHRQIHAELIRGEQKRTGMIDP